MTNALIGYSGFVGTTLLKQTNFEKLYRSHNIDEIKNKSFNIVVCAGAPAQKWIANGNPEADRQNIARLIEFLQTIKCERFILVSTVDVFGNPNSVDEETVIDETGLHPYGLHRRELEKFVEQKFSNHLIVRLPGLVGPGLRKNIIFDFLNDNNVSGIESRNIFQFYPMVNLWFDVQVALKSGLRLVHFASEPVSVADVALHGFGRIFTNELSVQPVTYDMRTLHAASFEADGNYQYSKRETIQAIRAYAQSEAPVTKPILGG
jgi:hypothetical protein